VDASRTSFVTARKIEIVLAVLLIRVDHLVTSDQLMSELWGSNPPKRANAGLHVYISELRKFLGRHGRSDVIVTRSPGYMLRLAADQLDFQSFLELADLGRRYRADRRYEEASDCLEKALAQWRGGVLGEPSDGAIVSSFANWLTEVRMECTQMLLDSQLELGRHRQVTGQLYSLVADSPLHEEFYRLLMLALYRSNRRADALTVYQRARKTLNDELGLEPCRALQDLHRAILLADDRTLATATAA
jgi:DNA-binding SARP family transcriptional activator